MPSAGLRSTSPSCTACSRPWSVGRFHDMCRTGLACARQEPDPPGSVRTPPPQLAPQVSRNSCFTGLALVLGIAHRRKALTGVPPHRPRVGKYFCLLAMSCGGLFLCLCVLSVFRTLRGADVIGDMGGAFATKGTTHHDLVLSHTQIGRACPLHAHTHTPGGRVPCVSWHGSNA